VPFARQIDTFANQCGKVHLLVRQSCAFVGDPSGLQHLLNCRQQPITVEQHKSVEVLPLRFRDFSSLQGLQVQPDGGNRCLEFVGDGVDEAVVLLVAPDLADQKDSIQNKAGRDCAEENQSEEDL